MEKVSGKVAITIQIFVYWVGWYLFQLLKLGRLVKQWEGKCYVGTYKRFSVPIYARYNMQENDFLCVNP